MPHDADLRMPTAFVPHGGGPWPVLALAGADPEESRRLADSMRAVASIPPRRPRALLVVSAHWEEARPTVTTSPAPPMLFDYSGFPPAAYQLQWSAPGDPALAARVRDLLGGAGFETAADPTRGFDHGTFVPMLLAYPAADLPTVQLSLVRGLDPEQHLAMGRALAPLRDEGVFVVGSGNSFHNMGAFWDPHPRWATASDAFHRWLDAAVESAPAERDRALTGWADAPSARACHPREEHLLPLMVAAGAAGESRGEAWWSGSMFGKRVSAHRFGA